MKRKKKSTWITKNHAGKNLPVDPILCKSSLKDKNVPNFDDDAKSFDNISNKLNKWINSKQKLQNTLLIERFFIKNVFDLMSLITCADMIYKDYLPYKDMHVSCLRRTFDATKNVWLKFFR